MTLNSKRQKVIPNCPTAVTKELILLNSYRVKLTKVETTGKTRCSTCILSWIRGVRFITNARINYDLLLSSAIATRHLSKKETNETKLEKYELVGLLIISDFWIWQISSFYCLPSNRRVLLLDSNANSIAHRYTESLRRHCLFSSKLTKALAI